MDLKYVNEVLAGLQPTFTEQGFTPVEGEQAAFKNDRLLAKVEYKEEKRLFVLLTAKIKEDGKEGEFKETSNWFFDEASHSEKDTAVIAEDFSNAILGRLGIKKVSGVTSAAEVELPAKALIGEAPTIEGFTQKFLAMAPQYKDAYKAHVAQYGEYLYLDFLKRTFTVRLREVVDSGSKKQIEKYFDMLGQMYYDGDNVVSNTVVGVVIAGAFKGDETLFSTLEEYMKEYPLLFAAGQEILRRYNKDKKLQQALAY